METHVKVLGILQIVLGAFGLVGAFIVMLVFGGAVGIVGVAGHQEPDAWIAIPIIGLIGGAIIVFLLVLSIPCVIAGIGLLQLKPWSRVLTIVLSVLNLVHFPLGTVVGIYGLWVLLSKESQPLFVGHPTGPGY